MKIHRRDRGLRDVCSPKIDVSSCVWALFSCSHQVSGADAAMSHRQGNVAWLPEAPTTWDDGVQKILNAAPVPVRELQNGAPRATAITVVARIVGEGDGEA